MGNSQDDNLHKEKERKLSKTQKILIIGFLCILAVIGAAAFLFFRQEEGMLVVDDSNLEDVEDQLSEAVAAGMFEVNMNTTWNFPDGKSASSDAYVANGNANSRPISFEVLLEGEELIYTSTVIPVGKQIKEIVLEKELPAGTYPAVCMYHLLNEDGTENSSCGINININIGE